MISLPLRYDAKVFSIEEYRDELHGILIAYEMRTIIESEQPSIREESFKASKKTRKKKYQIMNGMKKKKKKLYEISREEHGNIKVSYHLNVSIVIE